MRHLLVHSLHVLLQALKMSFSDDVLRRSNRSEAVSGLNRTSAETWCR